MIANVLLVNSDLLLATATYLVYAFFAMFLLHQVTFFLLAALILVLLTIIEIILGALSGGG